MRPTVATITPTIPPRRKRLRHALASIIEQDFQPDAVMVEVDHRRQGPTDLRNRMVWKSGTEWVAFLDDDDEWLPFHLNKLLDHALETGADLVYPWFDLVIHGNVDNAKNPLAVWGKSPYKREFDDEAARCLREHANFIPITCLVRREAFMDVGGFQPHPNADPAPANQFEDWGTWIAMLDAGAKFSHLPLRTWRWTWDGKNTSGRPDRW